MTNILTELAESVRDVAWIGDTGSLAVGGADGEVRVLSPAATPAGPKGDGAGHEWEVRHSPQCHLTPAVSRLTADIHGRLAVGSDRGHGGVTFIGLDGSATGPAPLQEPIPDLLSPGVVLSMHLDQQGTRLTVADLRGEVRITDLRSGNELSVDGLGDRARGACWWAGGQLLAIAADDELSIWRSCPDDSLLAIGAANGRLILRISLIPGQCGATWNGDS